MTQKNPARYPQHEDLPSTISTDTLELLRVGDPAAWSRTTRRYSPMLLRWCRRSGLKNADSEDVCQEVFRSVMTSLHRFRRETPADTFRGWLRRITQRRIVDFRKAKRTTPIRLGLHHLLEAIEGTSPKREETGENSNEVGNTIGIKLIETVRSEFETVTWEAFWRTTVSDEAPDAVAQSLGISRNSVYLAKSRILKRFRQIAAQLDAPLAVCDNDSDSSGNVR